MRALRACRQLLASTLAAAFALSVAFSPARSQSQPPAVNAPPGAAPAVNAPPVAPGANATLDSARAVRGEHLKLSIITYGPTNRVDERFGHDALAVRDTLSGKDFAYNWGMFSFDEPGFYTRFLTGETRYWMAPYPTAEFNQIYVNSNRTVRVQQLALTAVERGALLEFLVWNAAEANKFYRYDYYRDNCSTRLRDALDYILKGRLKVALDSGTTPFTWRNETERVTASNIPVYAGIELALGRNADKRLTPWAAGFMPERLADAVATVILHNEAGQRYRLVAHDSVVFASTRVPMPIDPPDRLAMAALLGLTLAGLVALMTDSRFRILRWTLVLFVTLWYGLGGILGTALLLAGTATKHVPYMGSNSTLWQISPLLLFAVLFIPGALARREASVVTRVLAAIIALFSVFGALLQLIPSIAQHSGVVIAVTLPVHLAITVAVLRTPPLTTMRLRKGAVAPRIA